MAIRAPLKAWPYTMTLSDYPTAIRFCWDTSGGAFRRYRGYTIRDDYFREIDGEGTILWEWFTCDHFDEFDYGDETKKLMFEEGGLAVGYPGRRARRSENLSDTALQRP